jgi:hypothetical protein
MKHGGKKFPRYVGTNIMVKTHESLLKIAERETEGNLSMTLRRALEDFAARHSNGDSPPSPQLSQ